MLQKSVTSTNRVVKVQKTDKVKMVASNGFLSQEDMNELFAIQPVSTGEKFLFSKGDKVLLSLKGNKQENFVTMEMPKRLQITDVDINGENIHLIRHKGDVLRIPIWRILAMNLEVSVNTKTEIN